MFQKIVCLIHLIQCWVSFNMFVFDRKDEDPEQKIEFKTRLGEFSDYEKDMIQHLSVCFKTV